MHYPTLFHYDIPITHPRNAHSFSLSRRGVLATTGHSTNFIMWIEIPSKRKDIINFFGASDQEVWIKAGVAAFSSLTY